MPRSWGVAVTRLDDLQRRVSVLAARTALARRPGRTTSTACITSAVYSTITTNRPRPRQRAAGRHGDRRARGDSRCRLGAHQDGAGDGEVGGLLQMTLQVGGADGVPTVDRAKLAAGTGGDGLATWRAHVQRHELVLARRRSRKMNRPPATVPGRRIRRRRQPWSSCQLEHADHHPSDLAEPQIEVVAVIIFGEVAHLVVFSTPLGPTPAASRTVEDDVRFVEPTCRLHALHAGIVAEESSTLCGEEQVGASGRARPADDRRATWSSAGLQAPKFSSGRPVGFRVDEA